MDNPVEKEVVENKQETSEKETFQEKYVEKVNTEEKRANIGVEDGVIGAYHVDMLTPIVKGISKVFPKQEVAIYKMNENTQAPMRISAGEEGLQADFFIAPRILTDDEIKECKELIEVFA